MPCIRMVLVLSTWALISWSKTADPNLSFEKFVLSNGLTVIVHTNHREPVVAFRITFRVGSRDESSGRSGLAHMIEHITRSPVGTAYPSLGAAYPQGSTDFDWTAYGETVPTGALDRTLWLESRCIRELVSTLTDTQVERDRGVVINEARQGLDRPYGQATTLLSEAAYPPKHPYHHFVPGKLADLTGITKQDVENWYEAHYGASQAIVALIGDIDAAAAKEKMEKYFGSIPPGPPVTRQGAWIAKITQDRVIRVQDRISAPRVYLAWNVPGKYSPEADDLAIAAELLAGTPEAPLAQRLLKAGLATEVKASVNERDISSQFVVYATTSAGTPMSTVRNTIEEELARIAREGPGLGRLDRARMRVLYDRVARIASSTQIARHFSLGEEAVGDPGAYQKSLKHISTATADEIQASVARWLTSPKLVLEFEPRPAYNPSGPELSEEMPPVLPIAQTASLRLQRTVLPNGLKVLFENRSGVPLVSLALTVHAGSDDDEPQKEGTARLLGSMLMQASASHSSEEMRRDLDSCGASVSTNVSETAITIKLSGLSEHMGRCLDAWAEMIEHPLWSDGQLREARQQLLAKIRAERADPFQAGWRLALMLLTGRPGADQSSLGAVGSEDLRAYFTRYFNPRNATIVAIGDLAAAGMPKKLQDLFSSWESRPLSARKDSPVPAKGGLYLVDRPGMAQSVVMLAQVLPGYHDDPGIEAADYILGGVGNVSSDQERMASRLWHDLRVEKHWTYGVYSTVRHARGLWLNWISGAVQEANTADAVREIDRELREMSTMRPPTADEIKNAQDRLAGPLTPKHSALEMWRQAITEQVELGLPDDYWANYSYRIWHLTAAETADGAKALSSGPRLWIVIGDAQKIEQPLRSAGVGDVRVLRSESELNH